eukprot:3543411-Rhodomonas_salina.1
MLFPSLHSSAPALFTTPSPHSSITSSSLSNHRHPHRFRRRIPLLSSRRIQSRNPVPAEFNHATRRAAIPVDCVVVVALLSAVVVNDAVATELQCA